MAPSFSNLKNLVLRYQVFLKPKTWCLRFKFFKTKNLVLTMLQVWHQVFSKSKNLVFTLFRYQVFQNWCFGTAKYGTKFFQTPKNLVLRYQGFSKSETWCLGNTKFDTKFFKIQKFGSSSYVQASGTKFFKNQKLCA